MSFMVDESTRVLIQGVTGQLGGTVIELMSRSAFRPVAGVTPGRGGEEVLGVPVFDTVGEATDATGANASLVLVPPAGLSDAVAEAIDSRLGTIALMVDGVPMGLSVDLISMARNAGVTLIGPNSPGVISPGKCLLGALNPAEFAQGDIAVISRSGGMMSTIAHTLAGSGFGTSTCLGIGGDSLIGVDMPEAVRLAEADPETRAIVIFGEIGTSQEERVGDLVDSGAVTKPVIAYIAGSAAPDGIRYSHAGAKSDGANGTARAKKKFLAKSGVLIAERYVDIPTVIARV